MKRRAPLANLVSVIIPVYNDAHFLREALASVFEQEYRPLEVIVVDDGSTDDSAAVAESFRKVRLIQQPHLGVSAARNAGIAASKGELLAFLDSDDVWLPHKLALQVSKLQAGRPLTCVYTRMRNLLHLGPPCTLRHRHEMVSGDQLAILPSALLTRREVFDKVGLFDETLHACEDSDWLLRARALRIALEIVAEPLLLRRIHDHNHSQRPKTHLAA